MIVTSVAVARVIWLFNLMDLNPHGRYIYDQLFPWLVERYRFAKAPSHAQDQNEKAWEFLDGRFVNGAGSALDVTLKVYNDGVVAETRSSTDDSEVFLVDVLSAATRELGLTFVGSMVHKRNYVSELNLTLKGSLKAMSPQMRAFSKVVSRAFESPHEPTTIGFCGDPASNPTLKIERKANVPLSSNAYWSIAGLPTPAHVELLEQFDAMLSE